MNVNDEQAAPKCTCELCVPNFVLLDGEIGQAKPAKVAQATKPVLRKVGPFIVAEPLVPVLVN